jgi:type I restriction enzyme S subunit
MSTVAQACNITTGKLDSNEVVANGEFPFFTCAKEPLTIDHYAFDDSVILVAGNNAQGNFHVTRFNGKFNAYQRTYVLTGKEGFDLDYVYFALSLSLKTLKDRAQGSQTKFLTMGLLKNLEFKTRSLVEQQDIAKALTALDAKIELNNRINAELEGMAKLLYDYWFVQFDFPMTAAQAAALGKPHLTGHPYRASGGKMIYNETLKREIPEGWTVGSLLDVATFTNGIACQKYPGRCKVCSVIGFFAI